MEERERRLKAEGNRHRPIRRRVGREERQTGHPALEPGLVRQFVAASRPEFEEELARLVEIPTVSVDPAYRGDISNGLEHAVTLMRRFGAVTKVCPTRGWPVLVGEYRYEGRAPTITLYNHMDVQPAVAEEWAHDPFRMRIDGERYYGRGATDDKGPALVALFAARHAAQVRLPLNIRIIWEFEEETGSPGFESFLKERCRELRTDSILVSDTVWVSRGRPSITRGLRGLLGIIVRLHTGRRDTHSGLVGGAARNPLGELVQVLSRCFDGNTGRVKISGFYDDVRRPSASELKDFLASGFTVARFKASHGLKKLRSEDASEVLKRIWAMPTFEIHGFAGGYTGPGIKTVIPAVAEAKVSMRLVPDQDPRRLLRLIRRHIRGINPDVEVLEHGFIEPYSGVMQGPFEDAAVRSMRLGFGKAPVFVRDGASIGAVLSMSRILKAPILLLGLSLPEHNDHGPDEYFDWGQASGGLTSFLHYFDEVSRL